MKHFIRSVFAALLAMLTGACDVQTEPQAPLTAQEKSMKASKTYLYLLRKTPFFTGLSTEQLRWVIDHSHEWEAQSHTVVASGPEQGDIADDVWILLDGGWQIEHGGRVYPSGHAEPGKWFSQRQGKGAFRVVTSEHSYLMKIERATFDDMLTRGFPFDSHLEDGRRYYGGIFADVP